MAALSRALPTLRSLGILLLFGASLLWVLLHPHDRLVYAGVVVMVLLSMIVTPLLQANQVYAFMEEQDVATAEAEREREAQDQRQDLLAQLYADPHNPHRDPLSNVGNVADLTRQLQVPAANPAQMTGSQAPSQISYPSDSPAMLLAATPTVDPASDADHDGLTALQEERLGTYADHSDTDNDLIPDAREVQGFFYNNKMWYSDPTSPDTNNDSLLDGAECPERVDNATAVCRDTDNDGTPDIFDADNDNDGVPDRIDISPAKVMGSDGALTAPQPFSDTKPLKLKLDQLEKQLVLVDFQLRPTDPAHLWYALNVYDWPEDDTKGQVQRPLKDTKGLTNTTFATYFPNGDARNANGDLRLVPMLEIRMTGDHLPLPRTAPRSHQTFAGNGITGSVTLKPATDSAQTQLSFNFKTAATYTVTIGAGTCTGATPNYTHTVSQIGSFTVISSLLKLADGNLVMALTSATAPAKSLCVPIGDIPNGADPNQMIDVDFLAAYGVPVREVDRDGTVAAYVPLNLVTDPATGDRQAMAARMPYWLQDPSNWGHTHEVRMVWLLSLLTETGGTDVVHVYGDQWTLTGLTVREERGSDLAIIWEDPIVDNDVNTDERLLYLAQNLERSFLAGRDSDRDNQRDVTPQEIHQRFDRYSNSSSTDEQRWGLPKYAFQVAHYTYTNSDEVARTMMTDTVNILNTYFLQDGQPRADAPLLLYAREMRGRYLGLDAIDAGLVTTDQEGRLTLSLDPAKIKPEVSASLSWAPYKYNHTASCGTRCWANYPVAQYADHLSVKLKQIFAASPSDERFVDVALVRGLYLALMHGSSRTVETGGIPQAAPNAEPDDFLLEDTAGDLALGTHGSFYSVSNDLANTAYEQFKRVASDPAFRQATKAKTIKQALKETATLVEGQWAAMCVPGMSCN